MNEKTTFLFHTWVFLVIEARKTPKFSLVRRIVDILGKLPDIDTRKTYTAEGYVMFGKIPTFGRIFVPIFCSFPLTFVDLWIRFSTCSAIVF